ncbi:hypothetical protein WR25_08805 isoform C [Diploscapter pachys]|uniref:Uncharacterized protein n=1 Tax=Diploscapter pachys TaxID=2018661 RepID=A0A2A2J7Q4_9BILA|nr:hypothetical protein WR25_08805 isoform B [Diploscapter pachys]PAV57818.1 hypothetical protein WR25_08805 isoform C [Diploscapter pachys]
MTLARSHSRSTDITDVSSDSIPSNHTQQPAPIPAVAQPPAGQSNQQGGGGLPQVQTLRSALQQVSNSHESQQQFSNFNRADLFAFQNNSLLPYPMLSQFGRNAQVSRPLLSEAEMEKEIEKL